MKRSSSLQLPTPGSYCLDCFGPLGPMSGVGVRCETCGTTNLRVDVRKFWNRDRNLRRLENELRLGVVALMVLIAGLIFGVLLQGRGGGHGYSGVGWSIGGPMLVGIILWDACGLLTRREVYLQHGLVWPLLGSALFLGPALLVVGLALVAGGNVGEMLLALLIVAVPSALGYQGGRLLVGWFRNWRRRFLERRLPEDLRES